METYRRLEDRWGLAEALEGFSALNAANDEPQSAARLAGAADALRDDLGARPLPADRVSVERYLAVARASVDPDVWRSAWDDGRSMQIEKAIQEAWRSQT